MSTRITCLSWGASIALVSSLMAPLARGQCLYPGECDPTCTQGPDVITGKLTGPANYHSLNGIEALSLGTYACNIGNVWVDWMSDNNRHPVIGGNLYKYSVVDGAGHFEQVGLSWLKHAFYADSDNLCCEDCQATDGTHLGVHCADPYTAGRNGTQSLLGPRWQVNAHTGAFPYPPANPPYSGSVARRLEVDESELAPSDGTTVRYFGESHYVTPDDCAAGNQNNNASYREVTASSDPASGEWTFDFAAGSRTERAMQAIQAWPLVDPGTQLTPVQLPNGGLYIVGSHATPIAAGRYHYEYAVYNMNDDDDAGSFSIPFCSGAGVTNIGFHGVTYRDGDGPGDVDIDNTPWPAALSTVGLTWSTQPIMLNIRANAIRWGTTYNFRFDSSAPPVSGLATVRLWKHPGSFTARVDVPGPACTTPSASFCAGDGHAAACPCNNSSRGNLGGCVNSLGHGARLTTDGVASVSADSIVLAASGMPNDTALYLQGSTGAGASRARVFGDGLLCLDGAITRLGWRVNAAGASRYPGALDVPISVRGAAAIGATRTYQVWYRDAAEFCTSSTENATNAIEVTWQP